MTAGHLRDHPWMGAAEAARALGVSRATLYAYVSRGFIRSQSAPGSVRERRYAREDVERLRRRTEARRDPQKAAAHALQWGVPILESSIALIDGISLYYRGHDAVQLARSRSLAEVASLVWTGRFDAPFMNAGRRSPGDTVQAIPAGDLRFVARAHVMLAQAAADDPLAFDLRAESVAITGWRILGLLVRAAVNGPRGRHPAAPSGRAASTHEEALARAWRVGPRGVDLLRNALILCADHELNVSSFTARCVASAGSHPYAVVIAGLAALEGSRHGGASARVESMLAAMSSGRHTRRLGAAVGERMRRGERIDGFGHPLYRGGDPRAAALLDLLRERYRQSTELAFVLNAADAITSVMREHPNIDFALASVARVLRLPPESPLAIFAIGRSIGWIGHALEQYATGQLIRPRARYVGVPPLSAPSPP